MKIRFAAFALLFFLVLGRWGTAQTPPATNSDQVRVEEWIRKLGSSSFAQREMARKELEALGSSALESLRHARTSSDVETQRRIAELIRQGEEQLLTRQTLAAKQIHLTLTDASVDQAIAELSKASGYTIQFLGDRTTLADKKITLDTGKTTFWQALDQFCDQAGLSEKIDLTPQAPPVTTIRARGRFRPIDTGAKAATPTPIILTLRTQDKALVSYAGAVKAQLRISRDEKAKEFILSFITSVEPRLLNTSLVGSPIIAKALDPQLQKLMTHREEPKTNANGENDGIAVGAWPVLPFNWLPGGPQRQTHIRLKEGKQALKQLKELAGKLIMQVDLTNERLARVEKVLEAAGHTVDGANGGTLKIQAVRKLGDEIEVQVTLENLTANPFGGNIFINGGNVVIQGNVAVRNIMIGRGGVRVDGIDSTKDLPELLDAKGQKFQIANVSSDGVNMVNGSWSTTSTIRYRPQAGQAAPSELVMYGTRTHTIAVPFHFENVTLP